ncbi:MAG: hypothetical protein GY859_39330, partial [Desulfobacterales bacterium]|nr:hypothetical protein [Desulfobacterales bacterium]
RSVFFIPPEGILNAWTANVRINNARQIAKAMVDTYKPIDFRMVVLNFILKIDIVIMIPAIEKKRSITTLSIFKNVIPIGIALRATPITVSSKQVIRAFLYVRFSILNIFPSAHQITGVMIKFVISNSARPTVRKIIFLPQ